MAVLLVALVILVPWSGAMAVIAAGDRHPVLQHLLAGASTVAGSTVALALLLFVSTNPVIRISSAAVVGDVTFCPDGLGAFMAAVASTIGCLAVIFSVDYMHQEAQLGRYYFLMLVFIGAMCGLVLTGSLFLLFAFWEITALCSYALISFYSDNPGAVAGGIRALVVTQVGGIGLLAGVLIVYTALGSYEITDFLADAHLLPPPVLGFVAYSFVLAAAAKSAQVPFHTWLPGAMEAPSPVSALIHAATMVNAGVYLLARFYPAFAKVPGWTDAVILIGVCSALIGAGTALVATDLKQVLACSTISQLGYMFYAIGVGAVFASQLHLLSHAVFKALLFLGAGAVIHSTGTRNLQQMGGLGRQMPFVRNTFAIGALALAGLPVANGFWSKELIMESGFHSSGWTFGAMLIGVGLTALYAIRVVWLVFYGKQRGVDHAHDAPAAMRFVLGALASGTITTWLLAGPLSELLQNTLPFHQLESETTSYIAQSVLVSPVTWVTLSVIASGIAAWHWRSRLAFVSGRLQPVAHYATAGFGFEWLNRNIIRVTQRIALILAWTQTGQLNWNAAGIVTALLLVLLIVWMRG